jgi:hypothetical protein
MLIDIEIFGPCERYSRASCKLVDGRFVVSGSDSTGDWHSREFDASDIRCAIRAAKSLSAGVAPEICSRRGDTLVGLQPVEIRRAS